MKAPGETHDLAVGNELDPYVEVVSKIQKNPAPRISVPHLSKLLGVKATTLNARFRRQQTMLKTVGRTSFIPVEMALDLAALHKYALLGWPTLQQASRLTGVKSGTLKARCEKGRVEGHMDLTKRLRICPAELNHLRVHDAKKLSKADGQEHEVEKQEPQISRPNTLAWLSYDPDRPFAVSECAVGQRIRYGEHEGAIVEVIDDPFSPMILARFPDHEHPLMREVLLIVEKRRTDTT